MHAWIHIDIFHSPTFSPSPIIANNEAAALKGSNGYVQRVCDFVFWVGIRISICDRDRVRVSVFKVKLDSIPRCVHIVTHCFFKRPQSSRQRRHQLLICPIVTSFPGTTPTRWTTPTRRTTPTRWTTPFCCYCFQAVHQFVNAFQGALGWF